MLRDAGGVDADARLLDAPADGPADAPAGCETPLADVFPWKLGNLALSDRVLFYGAYDPMDTTKGSLMALNVDTGLEAAPPLTTDGPAALVAANATDLYAFQSTRIWSIRAGETPAIIVSDRANIRTVTGDAQHVYWAERDPANVSQNIIHRRSLGGGTVEPIATYYGDVSRLAIVGAELYITSWGGSLAHIPVAGGTLQSIAYINGYPIHTIAQDGTTLYFANLYNNAQLYRLATSTNTASLLYQDPNIVRFHGLGLSATYWYVSGYHTFRINRTTHAKTTFHTEHPTAQNPVIDGTDVYLSAGDQTTSGERYILRCPE